MKSNVDLTLNRDFRKKNTNFKSIAQFIKNKKLLWDDFRFVNNSSNNDETQLIFTGDKFERKYKKYVEMRNNQCDRCGEILDKFPWYNTQGLCHICDSELESQTKKIPWKSRRRD